MLATITARPITLPLAHACRVKKGKRDREKERDRELLAIGEGGRGVCYFFFGCGASDW